MTLLTYQVFKTVAEIGSFHKAAQVLGLTPSAISHAISGMESELGFAVFTRKKSGVVLTPYGEYILPFINGVLNSDDSLMQAISEFNGLKQGKVKVGCFSSVCTGWLPDIIKNFKAVYPHIDIEIFQGSYLEVENWIKNGVVDFGFLSVSSSGNLPIKPLYVDPLVCVVPKDFEKESEGEYMTIEEMSHHQFVVQREETDADIKNYLRENKLNVQTDYHVIDDLSTVAMVANGFGICIMPQLTMKDIPYEVKQYPMKPAASRVIGIASLHTQYMAPAARKLYKYIVKEYGEM